MRLRILTVVDIKGWAIDGLNEKIIKHNPHIEFKVIYVHPKHVAKHTEELGQVLDGFKPHLIHYQYWNTCRQLLEMLPELKEMPSILTHHNVKEILNGDWSSINRIVTATNESGKKIADEYGDNNVSVVPYGIDLKKFKYNEEYPPKEKRIGYVGRVENWKRLDQIQKSAVELKEKVLAMGAKGKPVYWDSFPKDNIEFDLECSDEKLLENYRKMSVFVNNSRPGRESGPLPLLEAMAMGVPVVTTRTGMAQDIGRDGYNCKITDDEATNLSKNIKVILDDPKYAEKLRQSGWNTIKNYNDEKFARRYARIYREVIFEGINSVSVIIPTFNRADNLEKLLKHYEKQTYSNFEIVVCDDNSTDNTKEVVTKARKELNLTIKYVNTKTDGYGLAKARNLGIIEAEGRWLMFCDDRLAPEPKAISNFLLFATNRPGKIWFHGNKGGDKTSFVENFSFVQKTLVTTMGMFNERLTKYGGMTQDIKTRWEKIWSGDDAGGGQFKYYHEARAEEWVSSKAKNKRSDIADSKYLLYKTLQEPNEQTFFKNKKTSVKDI